MKRLIAATIATLFICALTAQAQNAPHPKRIRDQLVATNTATLATVAAADTVVSNALSAAKVTTNAAMTALRINNAASLTNLPVSALAGTVTATVWTASGGKVSTNAATAALVINNGANLTNVLAAWQYVAAPANVTDALANASGNYLALDAATLTTQYFGQADIGGTGTNWIIRVLTP